DMTPVRHQREVENRIRDAVRQDRARIQISRISRFGLLEMSRQRLSPSLGESSHHVCPRCQGTGKVRDNESLSLSILRLIEEEALKENTKQVHTIVPVQIASYLLNEKRKAVSSIEKRHDVEIIVVPNEAMETPHFSVFRVREGEELNELSYNLAKFHEAQDDAFVPEESLVSRNIETAAVTSEQVMESAAVSLSIPTAAPAPVERKPEGPSLFAKIVAAIKGLFASEPKEEEKNQNNRNNRNGNRNNRRNQDRRNNRRSRNENSDNAKNTDEENARPTRERVNNRRNRRNVNEEVISESAVNLANVSDDNRQEEKAEKPVAERRQRRDLRKRVRIDDNANNANENVIETVEVPAIKNEVVENNAVDNTEDKPRQERQRRTPRHLRASNNQRRRRNEVRSPMPLFAAVASPELASGKLCIDYSAVNAPKENNFLSVDELLEQEKTKKGVITPATGIVVEEKSVEAQPALDFITQPANEAVQQKVQESLERLHHKSEPVAQVATAEVEPQEKAKFVSSYVFTGRAGTISAVPHTKAAMTLAKAPDDESKPFPIVEWTESHYYFNGKGAAGHHSAISHIYSEPTQAKAE
ncbi:MAG: ribonuclease E/G, partial [Haemophilus parainfluenzae]|nr:ribonuclease E/G [Haemophilus parainfluenzae]